MPIPSLTRSLRALAGVALLPAVCPAQSHAFAHPDGTTHWYRVVAVPEGITWGAAHRRAAEDGGHLATLTSNAEHDFVAGLLGDPSVWSVESGTGRRHGPWLGGVQPSGSVEPDGGFRWVEPEPFTFTAWTEGQPDDEGGADRVCFGGDRGQAVTTWADCPSGTLLTGYVVEFSGPTVPRTVGLVQSRGLPIDEYVLLAPLRSLETWLLDDRGRTVHRWTSDHPPLAAELLPGGRLLRLAQVPNARFTAGGSAPLLEEFDWDGRPTWQFLHNGDAFALHHDFAVLPNGNVLVIAWELVTAAEAIAAGRDPARLHEGELWPDKILEVQRTGPTSGEIVWEWRAWDHLIQDFDASKANYGPVEQHPERIDVNHVMTLHDGEADWMHGNAIDYHAGLDQILLSVRHFDEIWVIDHSTTTEEARGSTGGRSGRGGDLLYRWGNPRAYRAGTSADQQLFQQHDAHWIRDGLPGAGNLLIFDNGVGRPGGDASAVVEIVPPAVDAQGNYERTGPAFGPAAPVWRYAATPPETFYSPFVSGAQRLPDGGTLVCGGWVGDVFELDRDGEIVWRYENPVVGPGEFLEQGTETRDAMNWVFRAPRYAAGGTELAGRELTPLDPIERHAAVLLQDGSTTPLEVTAGAEITLTLRAPAHPGAIHLVVTSLGPGVVEFDLRHVRVGPDVASLTAPLGNPVFRDYVGVLDAAGRGAATLAIPAVPGLAGIELWTAFLVADAAAPSGIGFASNTVHTRIVE